jgi:N-formylglutamate amidohydrolase
LRAHGLKVARNTPYAGGYVTELHGRPVVGRHALQIEINRSLYIVEGSLRPRDGFADVRRAMGGLVGALIEAAEAVG